MIYPNETRLTADEAAAFNTTADLANQLGRLPRLHPTEIEECVSHIHAIQKSILARAAYDEQHRTGRRDWQPSIPDPTRPGG